jgi:hypothetical protein
MPSSAWAEADIRRLDRNRKTTTNASGDGNLIAVDSSTGSNGPGLGADAPSPMIPPKPAFDQGVLTRFDRDEISAPCEETIRAS